MKDKLTRELTFKTAMAGKYTWYDADSEKTFYRVEKASQTAPLPRTTIGPTHIPTEGS